MTEDQKIQGVATTTGTAHIETATSAASIEPLVLKPEWQIKDKDMDESKVRKFVFTFDEDTNKLSLHVNNKLYREFSCKDNLSASIKFHEALDKALSCFTSWKIYDRN